MLDWLKKKVQVRGTKAIGVHLYFQTKDSLWLDMVEVIRHQKEIHLKKKGSAFGPFSSLRVPFKTQYPVILSVDGQGVACRHFQGLKENFQSSSILPFVSSSDLLFEIYSSSVDSHWGVVSRKDFTLDIIEWVEKNLGTVVDFHLGPFNAVYLKENLNNVTSIPVRNRSLSFHAHDWEMTENLSRKSETVQISNEEIPSEFVIPFSNTFRFLVGAPLQSSFPLPQQEIFFFKRAISLIGKSSLALFLLLLLSNFFLFDHYRNRAVALNQEYQSKKTVISEVQNLTVTSRKLEKAISQLEKPPPASFYLDRLSTSLPVGISFIDAQFYPITTKIKSNKEIQFKNHSLIIKGKVSYGKDLDNWLNKLNQISWIQNTHLANFHREENKEGLFELYIELNPPLNH